MVAAAADGSSGSTRWRASFSSMMVGANGIRSGDLIGSFAAEIELPQVVFELIAEQDVIDACFLRQAVEFDAREHRAPGLVELAHDLFRGRRELQIVELAEAAEIAVVALDQRAEVGRGGPQDFMRIGRLIGWGGRTVHGFGTQHGGDTE